MQTNKKKAFTIIELLVVVSIIALLIGILLPAIGKARDRAHQTQSMANLRQLGQAHATYGAEWNDNQWTTSPHNLATYGNSLDEAVNGFKAAFAGNPKSVAFCDTGKACVRLGFAFSESKGQQEYFWGDTAHNTHGAIMPMNFTPSGAANRRFGSYRMINAKPFNVYLEGRVYGKTFFAPKDRTVISGIGECWDAPGEFCALAGGTHGPISSSYITSPAALYAPDLFRAETSFTEAQMFSKFPGAFRTPTFGQARYPDLKTHMLEHHWLQRTRRDCIPGQVGPLAEYNGCAPYFFNASRDSSPATLFYDGHVEMLGVREAIQASAQSVVSSKIPLWHPQTPLASSNHYYHTHAYVAAGGAAGQVTSFHILTTDGILGRDTFSR